MEDPENEEKKKMVNDYVKYSGIGFQMLGIILVGVFVGRKLDQWIEPPFPVFTLIFTLGSVGLAMFVVIREVTGTGKKKK